MNKSNIYEGAELKFSLNMWHFGNFFVILGRFVKIGRNLICKLSNHRKNTGDKRNLKRWIFGKWAKKWIVKLGLTRVKFHYRRVALRVTWSCCTSECKHASGCFALKNFFRNLNIRSDLRRSLKTHLQVNHMSIFKIV